MRNINKLYILVYKENKVQYCCTFYNSKESAEFEINYLKKNKMINQELEIIEFKKS